MTRIQSPDEDETRWKLLLTEHEEGESEARQAETLKEPQGAEHGDVHREGHAQTEDQHEEHRDDQHRVTTKPRRQTEMQRSDWERQEVSGLILFDLSGNAESALTFYKVLH